MASRLPGWRCSGCWRRGWCGQPDAAGAIDRCTGHTERHNQRHPTATGGRCRLSRLIRIFPARHHGLDQIVFFDEGVISNRRQVQANQQINNIGGPMMQARQEVAPVLADQIKQGANKRNIVVSEQTVNAFTFA